MLDRRDDASDSLRQVLIQPQPVEQSPPAVSLGMVVLCNFGVVAGVVGVIMGIILTERATFAGWILIIVSLLLGFGCYHLSGELKDKRARYQTWLDEHGRDPRATYRREVQEQTNAFNLSNNKRIASYFPSNNNTDAQVAAIQALKEIELAKMHLPHQERLNDRRTAADLLVTKLTTETQVETTRIQADAQKESARYSAMGQMGVFNQEKELERFRHDLAASEAREEREWKASEAEKDRKLTTDQLLAKHKHEVELIEKRIRSAKDMTDDQIAAFELYKAQVDAIDKEEDEDKKERMIRGLDRMVYR